MSNTSRARASTGVPEDICLQMKQILLSYPNGIELCSLPNAYQKRFGHGLQYTRMGYSSMHQFVRAVPGIRVVPIDNREYVIYSSTIARKLSPPFDIAPPGFSDSATKYPTHPYIVPSPKLDQIDTLESGIPDSKEMAALCEDPLLPATDTVEPAAEDATETVEEQEKPPEEGTSPDPNTSPPSTPGTSVSRTLPLVPCSRPLNQAAQLAMHKQTQGQNMFDKLSQEISDLLCGLAEVTPLEELEAAYQARYGFELPYAEFGFASARELAESLWNVCSLEQRDGRVFVRCLDENLMRTTEPIYIEDNSDGGYRVDPELGKRVRNLLLKWPSGMPMSLLQGKYRDAYKEDLPILELGFDDLLCLMIAMNNCVRLRPWNSDTGTPDYILHGVPLTNEELQGQVLPAPSKPALSSDVIPYEKQPVPQSWEFNVYLPFISNPDRFWIQVVGHRTTSAAEEMLERMSHFYNNLSCSEIPDYLISSPAEGQNCAAPYQSDGNYYRARVLKILSPDLVEVYYVDYGNKSRVPVSSLRRIELSNMILPAQAIRCRLANVRPVEFDRWSPGSANKMKDLTDNQELFCKVQNVEQPDDTLSVHLYNSRSESSVSINQALIASGIAVHEDNNTPLHPARARACLSPEETCQMTSSTPYPPPPPQNLYPPPLSALHIPYNLPPPGMMPPSLPYPGMPFYNYPPQPMGAPLPYMNPILPAYPHPNHYIPSYAQPTPAPPPLHRNYLTASASPPQAPLRPTLNFQPSSQASAKPVSLPDSSTLLHEDTYVFNDKDNRDLEIMVGEKRPVLEKRDQLDLSPDMGSFEKVQKYLTSSNSPEGSDVHKKSERERLEQLKKSREELVISKFDMSDQAAFKRYLSQLNSLSSEIETLENKFAEGLTLGEVSAPSPPVAPAAICDSSPSPLTLSMSQPALTNSFPPPPPPRPPPPIATQSPLLRHSLALAQPPSIGTSQNQDPQGPRTLVKYKGIGRGGKMSDLV